MNNTPSPPYTLQIYNYYTLRPSCGSHRQAGSQQKRLQFDRRRLSRPNLDTIARWFSIALCVLGLVSGVVAPWRIILLPRQNEFLRSVCGWIQWLKQ